MNICSCNSGLFCSMALITHEHLLALKLLWLEAQETQGAHLDFTCCTATSMCTRHIQNDFIAIYTWSYPFIHIGLPTTTAVLFDRFLLSSRTLPGRNSKCCMKHNHLTCLAPCAPRVTRAPGILFPESPQSVWSLDNYPSSGFLFI